MIYFYTGKNGSGKSRALLNEFNSNNKNIAIINTSFTKFKSSPNVLRISSKNARNNIKRGLAYVFNNIKTFNISEILSFFKFLNLDERISIKANSLEDYEYNDFFIHNEYDINHFLRKHLRGNLPIPLANFSKKEYNPDYNLYLFEEIDFLKKNKIISSYQFIFYKNEREFLLDELSSGEQTLLSIYFYMLRKVKQCNAIFIDEPENSLHPEWQYSLSTVINAAIGYRYQSVKIYIATHSPLIISGGINEYKDECIVFHINDQEKERIHFDQTYKFSVEEILWKAYDSSPPANHTFSVKLNELINNFLHGNISEHELNEKLDDFENKILVPKGTSIEKYNKQFKLIQIVRKKIPNLLGGEH